MSTTSGKRAVEEDEEEYDPRSDESDSPVSPRPKKRSKRKAKVVVEHKGRELAARKKQIFDALRDTLRRMGAPLDATQSRLEENDAKALIADLARHSVDGQRTHGSTLAPSGVVVPKKQRNQGASFTEPWIVEDTPVNGIFYKPSGVGRSKGAPQIAVNCYRCMKNNKSGDDYVPYRFVTKADLGEAILRSMTTSPKRFAVKQSAAEDFLQAQGWLKSGKGGLKHLTSGAVQTISKTVLAHFDECHRGARPPNAAEPALRTIQNKKQSAHEATRHLESNTEGEGLDQTFE